MKNSGCLPIFFAGTVVLSTLAYCGYFGVYAYNNDEAIGDEDFDGVADFIDSREYINLDIGYHRDRDSLFVDSDGDGLGDELEVFMQDHIGEGMQGFDPNVRDLDGNGNKIPDVIEPYIVNR